MEISEEDIKKIETLVEITKRTWHCDSKQVTDLYNKYVQYPKPPVQNTNCTSCIRRRVLDLEKVLNKYKEEKKEK